MEKLFTLFTLFTHPGHCGLCPRCGRPSNERLRLVEEGDRRGARVDWARLTGLLWTLVEAADGIQGVDDGTTQAIRDLVRAVG